MSKPNITDEMVKKLVESHQSNKETLQEMKEFIDDVGYLNNGLTDINESFEMGYNNALEYVFKVLGIKNYEPTDIN